MSLKNKSKEEIYLIIDEIIKLEDEINLYKNNNNFSSVKKDIIKNKENIKILNQFISNEKKISIEKISTIKNDIKTLKQILIKNKENNLNKKNTKKEFDQNLIKQKCYEKTLLIYTNEIEKINNNLKMLKEEKITIEQNLLNLMSLRENYEEFIYNNSKLIFKNLIISYDEKTGESLNNISQSIKINNNNNFNIENFDIFYLNISLISNFIYKEIFTKFIISLENDVTLKQSVFNCIEDVFNNFKIGKIRIENFVKILSINLINIDTKLIDFINQIKFEFLLKFIIKKFSLDKIIQNYLNFINFEYKSNKNKLIENLNNFKEKIKIIKENLNEINKEFSIIIKEKNEIKDFNNKINKIKNNIFDKEKLIKNIEINCNNNIKQYENEIKNLEKINKMLENKFNEKNKENKTIEIQNEIDNKFIQIKNILKNLGNEKNFLLKSFMNEINNALNDFDNNDFKFKTINNNNNNYGYDFNQNKSFNLNNDENKFNTIK